IEIGGDIPPTPPSVQPGAGPSGIPPAYLPQQPLRQNTPLPAPRREARMTPPRPYSPTASSDRTRVNNTPRPSSPSDEQGRRPNLPVYRGRPPVFARPPPDTSVPDSDRPPAKIRRTTEEPH